MTVETHEQVARILDEDAGRTVGVLVQARPDGSDQPLLDSRRYAQATSARDVLPEPVRAGRAAAALSRANAGGVPRSRSATPDLSANGPGPTSLAGLRRANSAAVESLLACDPVGSAHRNGPGAVAAFWPSRSAYLELDRDDVARLAAEPGVAAVYPNVTLSLLPVAAAGDLPQSVLDDSASSWGIDAVGALAVWGAYDARGAGSLVGVLDSGVDATHPDLLGKVAHWAEFDAQGQPVEGSTPVDTKGHGTHVCGTIAGGDASGQWIGMAPQARLAVARVLPEGSGTGAQIQAGIMWAIERGVDVLSMSLSAPTLDATTGNFVSLAPGVFSEAFRTCRRAGIPVVAAMGNRGGQTGATTGGDLFALGVGAVDHRDQIAGFSGGLTEILTASPLIDPTLLPLIFTKPDLSAPGVAVTSSFPGGTWKALNGTSMATPHVAGAIALLLSAVPSIRAAHTGSDRARYLINQLIGSVDELGEAGQDSRYGFGRLNVLRAVALARAVHPEPTP